MAVANPCHALACLLNEALSDWLTCCAAKYPADGSSGHFSATERAERQIARDKQWQGLVVEAFRRRPEFHATWSEMRAAVDAATVAFNRANQLPIQRLEAPPLDFLDTLGADQYLRVSHLCDQAENGERTENEVREQLLRAGAALEQIALCGASAAESTSPDGSSAPPKKTKGSNINARMLSLLAQDVNRSDWTARQFAEALGCRESTVKETTAWKGVMKTRAMRAAESAFATGALNGGRSRRS